MDDPCNCLTLCSGSLNADPRNSVADIVRKRCDRIAFAHIRNAAHLLWPKMKHILTRLLRFKAAGGHFLSADFLTPEQ